MKSHQLCLRQILFFPTEEKKMLSFTLDVCLLHEFWLPVELRQIVIQYAFSEIVDNHSCLKAVIEFLHKRDDGLMMFGPIEYWDTSRVTRMNGLFNGEKRFNEDISRWDVSNVTDMEYMFNRASSFNQSLANWDVSKVKTMQNMFASAVSFNQPLATWNVSGVNDMSSMFYEASSFNQNVENWNVAETTTVAYMLHGTSFMQPSFRQWKLAKARSVELVFSRKSLTFNHPIRELLWRE